MGDGDSESHTQTETHTENEGKQGWRDKFHKITEEKPILSIDDRMLM